MQALGRRVQGWLRGRRYGHLRVQARRRREPERGPDPAEAGTFLEREGGRPGGPARRGCADSSGRKLGASSPARTVRGRTGGSRSQTWAGASSAPHSPSAISSRPDPMWWTARPEPVDGPAPTGTGTPGGAPVRHRPGRCKLANWLPTGPSAAGPTVRNDRSATCGAGSSTWISGGSSSTARDGTAGHRSAPREIRAPRRRLPLHPHARREHGRDPQAVPAQEGQLLVSAIDEGSEDDIGQGATARMYGVGGFPTNVLIDRNGQGRFPTPTTRPIKRPWPPSPGSWGST